MGIDHRPHTRARVPTRTSVACTGAHARNREDTINIFLLDENMFSAGALAFKHVPWTTYTFKVITIEHDSYRFGTKVRDFTYGCV